jgi:DivIVA domain-containing protein
VPPDGGGWINTINRVASELRRYTGESVVLERVTGIEPAPSAWEAEVLPLNHTRNGAHLTVAPAPDQHSRRTEGVVMAIFGARRRTHFDCSVHGPLSPQDVLDMTFVVRKVGVGYDPDEVDDYLDSVAASMAGFAPPVSAWDIRQHEFTVQRKRNSFNSEEVDNFLECIAQTLEGRAGQVLRSSLEFPPGFTGYSNFPDFPGNLEVPPQPL